MKIPRLGRKKLLLIGIVLLVAGASAAVYIVKFKDSTGQNNQTGDPAEQTVKEKMSAGSVDDLKEGAKDDVDAFNLMTSTASLLEGSGDPEGAQEYYEAAVEHAESTGNQELKDSGYRLLLVYYRNAGKSAEYDRLAAKLGEAKMQELFKPDPRDVQAESELQ